MNPQHKPEGYTTVSPYLIVDGRRRHDLVDRHQGGVAGIPPLRRLGRNGPQVGALGYGAMVLEGYYGASEDGAALGAPIL